MAARTVGSPCECTVLVFSQRCSAIREGVCSVEGQRGRVLFWGRGYVQDQCVRYSQKTAGEIRIEKYTLVIITIGFFLLSVKGKGRWCNIPFLHCFPGHSPWGWS
jgi:hypothetical protein